jgi:hypothetical protein
MFSVEGAFAQESSGRRQRVHRRRPTAATENHGSLSLLSTDDIKGTDT